MNLVKLDVKIFKNYHLSQRNHVGNGPQNHLAVFLTVMRNGKASNVQDEVEEIVDCQGAHQQVEVSHNLQSRAYQYSF